MTDIEITTAIKSIHALLRSADKRSGFEARALLLTLAFLKGRPVESQERTTSARTRYTWANVPAWVAGKLEKKGPDGRVGTPGIMAVRWETLDVFEHGTFPLEDFKAWYGDPALRVKEYQRAVAALPADPTEEQQREAMWATLDVSDASRLFSALRKKLKAEREAAAVAAE